MQESISFGQWLKRRRKALDLTQAALARAVPCAVQTIRALEADELRPSRELAARLAQVLGLPTSDHSTFVAFARGRLDAVPPEAPTINRALDSGPLNLPVLHTPLVEQAHDISTPVSTAPIAYPSGTVTFLFTDIEGSTQLWEHTPQAMHTALARHDDIMHESVNTAGGYLYKTIGDACQAAFATAAQALAAALATQRALHTEAWGTPRPLRVRMALHTGVTGERAGDYAGPLLNRVARLMAAGHGGQILISAATHELVWDQLPPGVTLRDLGVHLLKDLIRPEPIFQLVAPDLPSDFPALKTRGSGRSNLPAQATPFIGREQEVEAVYLYMRDPIVRLLTLTGPGGTGKTRLALQSAAALHDTFPDGVWFVDLAPIQDATLVVAAIAQTLNIREILSEAVTERLTSYLRDKQLLLFLDNFEQVLAASVLLGNLLGAAPQVKMLVTSRARLHLSAEHELPVPPLAVPDLQHLPSPDRLMQVDAVQLFVTRARAVQPGFQLTETNAQAVAAICIHLDGLPLAIELAAARSKLLAPQALLTRLGHRLHMLTGGTRDLALRHQTLRSTIDWSYALLDAATQTLFRRLGVFVSGWTVEAADAVCAGVGSWGLGVGSGSPAPDSQLPTPVLDGLASLLDNSLVQQFPIGTDEEPRFTMLETLREYALEQVTASGEIEAIRRQHAIYYLGVAEVGAPKLQSTQWRMWQTRLEAELENFRAALQWSLESGEAELGLRLGAALVGHWWVPAFLPEWYRQVQETAVTTTSSLPPATRANILRHVGRFAFLQGDYPRAMMLLEQGVVFCRETGDQSDLAGTLMFLADVVRDMGDYARASMLYQESLDIYRQLDDTSSLAWLYHSWSDMAVQQGEDAQGLALSQEGLRLFRALDAKPGMGLALHLQGIFRQRQGDDASALACLAECLDLFKEVGSVMGIAIGLGGLAVVMITLGQGQPADSVQRIATTRRAVQLLGAAEALREASSCPLFQVQRKEFDRAIPVARAVLDEATFMCAWTDGRAMSLEQATAYALDEVG